MSEFVWKLKYTRQRDDGMWEASFAEDEGLFTVGVRASEEGAVAEAKQKCVDLGVTSKFEE